MKEKESTGEVAEKSVIKVRSQYSPRVRVALYCDPASGNTQQQFREEVNINNIVKKYHDTGMIQQMANSQGSYGYATSQSFTEAMHIVANARSEFERLPSSVRSHFENDTSKFLDAVQDPERKKEFIELGLVKPDREEIKRTDRRKPASTPLEVPPVQEPPGGDTAPS